MYLTVIRNAHSSFVACEFSWKGNTRQSAVLKRIKFYTRHTFRDRNTRQGATALKRTLAYARHGIRDRNIFQGVTALKGPTAYARHIV